MDGSCLIVTDESLMRGVDYRLKEQGSSSKTDGIDLLVAGSFSNRRAYIQGLARVGRYNEPCSRYRLASIQMINKEKENELYIKLSKLSSMQK